MNGFRNTIEDSNLWTSLRDMVIIIEQNNTTIWNAVLVQFESTITPPCTSDLQGLHRDPLLVFLIQDRHEVRSCKANCKKHKIHDSSQYFACSRSTWFGWLLLVALEWNLVRWKVARSLISFKSMWVRVCVAYVMHSRLAMKVLG